ncbi:MAG: TetR/AcrR family transcriptional regulator [Candidatus Zixiibacteriota bacterium]
MARPKEINSESLRKINDAATTEFAEFGLTGARVDRIARRAGVNKAMIYYHYSSKENLYVSILTEKITELSKVIKTKIDSDEGIESVLLTLSQFYNIHLAAEPRIRQIFLHEMASGAKYMRTSFAEIMQHQSIPRRLMQVLEKGMDEGKYRRFDARQAIIAFIGMNFFYIVSSPLVNQVWEIEDEETFRRERPAEMVRLFLKGIEKHEES